ncbi:MAG: hypothetical protein CMH57_00145 [Myxococcales bacterium]|nr:hypothetical protein [Myxococcales bacterium]
MNKFKVPALGIVLAMLVLTGCVEEEASVLVVGNERPGNTCELTANQAGPFLSRGVMDISLTKRYVMAPVLLNQLGNSKDVRLATQSGDPMLDDTQIEGNTIILDGANVSFTTNVPALELALQSDLFIPVGGTVFPSSTAAIGLEVISEALGRQIENTTLFDQRGTLVTILVNVTFTGRSTAGRDIESTEFSFPLDICSGCLLNYPPGTLFPDDDGSQTCDVTKDPNNTGTANSSFESVCIYGQDEAVDCRLCRSAVGDPTDADDVCDP